MKCPNCGKEITDDSLFCEHCGAKVTKETPKKPKKWVLWLVGILACIVSFVVVASVLDKKDEPISRTEQAVRKIPAGYVDLGLPSGTLWKDHNEACGLITYDQALKEFGNRIPDKEQMLELKNLCNWTWNGNGYTVEGPSGKTITLPAEGSLNCDGGLGQVGIGGYYWSSTPGDSDDAWHLDFDYDEVLVECYYYHCVGQSIRLVR